MKMLLYKAWVETRVRFFASLVAATIVCVFNMQQHAWLVKWWAQELQDPKGYHLAWMVLGIHNYGWYLWHYLYNNYLQQVWALFALLFAFGGLITGEECRFRSIQLEPARQPSPMALHATGHGIH